MNKDRNEDFTTLLVTVTLAFLLEILPLNQPFSGGENTSLEHFKI